jgi:hypothetical protein
MIGDDKLIALSGTWVGSEQLLPTAWTPAGTAEGKFVIATAPAGVLVIDYTGTRDGSTALSGHGVVAEDGWWWFDSYGFVPRQPGIARWEHGTLELERRSERGRTVMRLEPRGQQLNCEIVSAVPADAELAPMLIGRYERCGREDCHQRPSGL